MLAQMARIGLVLGAGGASGGAFHAGVLTALAEYTGWDPREAEVVVGTSAGSITGAVLRAGLPAPDLMNRMLGRPLSPEGTDLLGDLAMVQPPPIGRPDLRRMPRALAAPLAVVRAASRPWAVRPGSLAAALLPPGTVATEVISSMVGALAGDEWPKDDLRVCAVRLSTGRRVVFRRDATPEATLGEAVAASCAIPSFFEPVRIGEARYVDGGVHSPTNLDLMAGMGLDLVIVSSPMSAAGGTFRVGRVGVDAPLRRFCRAMLDTEASRVRGRGTPVIAFQPTPDDQRVMGINAMDGSRRAAVALHIRESTHRRLARQDTKARLEALFD
jgi:NTE family protein